jgi:hypothetical protein
MTPTVTASGSLLLCWRRFAILECNQLAAGRVRNVAAIRCPPPVGIRPSFLMSIWTSSPGNGSVRSGSAGLDALPGRWLIEVGQQRHLVADQHPAHGRPGHAEVVADPVRTPPAGHPQG